jgi:hypothetical protein
MVDLGHIEANRWHNIRVRVKDTRGNWSDWSEFHSVLANRVPPDMPVITYPQTGTNFITKNTREDITVRILYHHANSVPLGTIVIEVCNRSSFASDSDFYYHNEFDTSAPAVTNWLRTAANEEEKPDPLPSDECVLYSVSSYYIRVKVIDAKGAESEWSLISKIDVQYEAGEPTIEDPEYGASAHGFFMQYPEHTFRYSDTIRAGLFAGIQTPSFYMRANGLFENPNDPDDTFLWREFLILPTLWKWEWDNFFILEGPDRILLKALWHSSQAGALLEDPAAYKLTADEFDIAGYFSTPDGSHQSAIVNGHPFLKMLAFTCRDHFASGWSSFWASNRQIILRWGTYADIGD